jgi:hypothetical protein
LLASRILLIPRKAYSAVFLFAWLNQEVGINETIARDMRNNITIKGGAIRVNLRIKVTKEFRKILEPSLVY